MSLAQLRRIRRLERKLAPPEQWSIPLDPVEMAREAGIELDDWQANVVRSESTRILINASRQSGKSLSAAVLAVHTALSEADSLVLCVAPSLRQSSELFRSCLQVYRGLGRPVLPRQESALRLELRNNSRIISLPGTEATLRGLSRCKLLLADEASRIPEELIVAVRPMLAVSNGRLVALSTPAGTRGWWYDAWRSDEPYERYEIPAPMCKRISQEFLDEEERTIGRYWFESEYLCKFNDAETAAFRSEDLEKIIKYGVEQWQLTSAS